MSCLELYEPINTLKAVADDLWIVDGPEIAFGFYGFNLPFPTRMTIARLADRRLWVHSPTPLTDSLLREIASIGEVAWLVAPNRIHHWWVPEWQRAFPAAETHAAPKVMAEAGDRLAGPVIELADIPPSPWRDDFDQVGVAGGYLTEFVFFHRPSKTAIVTDLVENFERERITCGWLRLLVRIDGIAAPNGTTPRDFRLTFLGHRSGVKAAAEKILSWQPDRVILAHGRWFRENGTAELRRALAWCL